MKILLISLFLLPIYLGAQECKLKKTTDPYTKETKLSTRSIPLDGTSLSVHADSKEIDFFFVMDGKEKCFNDASAVTVIYEGKNAKANFKHGGSMNCDGFFHIIFKNTAATSALLQRLTTQKITSFQFTDSNKGKITVMLSPEEQALIMSRADCLIKESKALIK